MQPRTRHTVVARWILRAVLLTSVAIACVERQAGVGPGTAGVATVVVAPPTANLGVNGSLQFVATARDAAGQPLTGRTFDWTTSASGVASVNANGMVQGMGTGSATIRAAIGNKSGSAAVTVTSTTVQSVEVTPPAASVLVNTTVQLNATPRDANNAPLAGRPVTWRSSDSTRARVSTTGLVTGLVIGSTTITATSEGKSGTAAITVTQVPVATLEVAPTTASILIAGTRQLTATARDAAGNVLTLRPITWQSSDTTKVRVNGTGLVTGVAAGTAAVTASCEGKTATASIDVSVAPVANVQVTPPTTSVLVNATVQLTAVLRDANGNTLTGRTIAWSSSNDLRAQVNSTGLVLGVGAGSVTITATSEGRNGTATVTVNAVPVATVTVTPPTSNIVVNGTVQLTATLKDTAGNDLTGRTVTWTSSHATTRASVSTSGLVTGLGAGTATITASSEGRSGTATVTVAAAPVATVTVSPSSDTVAVGATAQYNATLRDAGGNILTGRVVTWSSSDPTKAQVSTNGLALGIAAGTATITATSEGRVGSASVLVTAAAPGTVLFSESFDDNLLANRGWYDLSSPTLSTTEKHSGTAALEARWTSGAQSSTAGAMRKLFTPTSTLYVSYWVKYSTNYVGSGQLYHPHEFSARSSLDGDWDAPTFSYLNAYIEQNYQNGGIPRLIIQDDRMIDITRIMVDLTGVTENRSVAGCNGNTDGTGSISCYQVGPTEWNNFKEWDAPTVAFRPTAGPDYKSDWNHVEVYFQLNTIVGGIGQTNGIVRYWLNGNLKIELTNVLFRTGANPTLQFKQFFFGPYIGDGSPVAQTMWVDDLVVGTAKP